MTKERTEEQILASEPLTVILGGREREVKLLTIKASRAWRKTVVDLLISLPQFSQIDSKDSMDSDRLANAINTLMGEQVADLFFAYAIELPRPDIEEEATDQELAIAFEQVTDIAFPFAGSVVGLATRLSQ